MFSVDFISGDCCSTVVGDLSPRHMQIFKTNEFFAGITLPQPDSLEPFLEKLPKHALNDPNILDFLYVSGKAKAY